MNKKEISSEPSPLDEKRLPDYVIEARRKTYHNACEFKQDGFIKPGREGSSIDLGYLV